MKDLLVSRFMQWVVQAAAFGGRATAFRPQSSTQCGAARREGSKSLIERANEPGFAAVLTLAPLLLLLSGFVAQSGAFFTAVAANQANAVSSASAFAPTLNSASASGSSIVLAWTAPSGGWATGYRVYRGTASGGPYTLLTSGGCALPVSGVTCTDATVTGGTYYYVIQGISADGGSATYSNELSVTLGPGAPTNLVATAIASGQVELTWTAPSSAVDGYIIQRATASGGPYSAISAGGCASSAAAPLSPAPPLTCTDTDPALVNGTTSHYIAYAVASGVLGSGSNEDSATVDSSAPTVNSTSPTSGATNQLQGVNIAVTFSEAMDTANTQPAVSIAYSNSATCGTFPNTLTLTGAFTWSGGDTTLTYTHDSDLLQQRCYQVTVSTNARDAAGNVMAAAFTFTFVTADSTAPTVSATTPANGAISVPRGIDIRITFNETMDTTVAPATVVSASPAIPCNSGLTWFNSTTLQCANANNTLAADTTYTITVGTAARDLAGNALAASYRFVFSTGAAVTGAPTVTAVAPVNGATGVSAGTTVQVTFSAAMDTATTSNAFSLSPGGMTCSSGGTCAWNSPTNTVLTFTPGAALAADTSYTVLITATATLSATGVPMASDFSSSFRTSDTVAPTVSSTSPTNGSTGVAGSADIVITFNEPMSQAATQGALSMSPGGYTCTVNATCSWDNSSTLRMNPTANTTNSTQFVVTVSTAAQDLTGNALAAAYNFTFSTGDTVSAPSVTGVSPADGASGAALNTTVQVTFSQAMNTGSAENSFCLSRSGSTCSASGISGSFGWNAPTNTIMTFTPGTNLLDSTTYVVSINGNVATSTVGVPMTSSFSSSFTTVLNACANCPTVVIPDAQVSTADASFTIQGTAPANALIKVYDDPNDTNSLSGLLVVASTQLEGGLTSWSVNVPLSMAANNFLVTATVGATEFGPTNVFSITRVSSNLALATGLVRVTQVSNTAVSIEATFSGDTNANGTASYQFRCVSGAGCPTTFGSSTALTRGSGQFTGSQSSGLAGGSTYEFRVTHADANGVTGTNPQSAFVSFSASIGGGGPVSSSNATPTAFAPAGGQSTTATFTLSGPGDVKVEVVNASGSVVRTLQACTNLGAGTYNYAWDGRNAASVLQAEGQYSIQLSGYSSASGGCTSNTLQVVTLSVVISNPQSITMTPPPSSLPYMTPGSCRTVTAEVYNNLNQRVTAGVNVAFSYELTDGTSPANVGTYHATSSDCSTNTAGTQTRSVATNGSGVSTVYFRTDSSLCTNYSCPIVIVLKSQSGEPVTGQANGSTTVNDPPPDAPQDLELSVGSIRMRWKASSSPNTSGYLVFISRTAGLRDRIPAGLGVEDVRKSFQGTGDLVVDAGGAKEYVFEDVTPGATYYVSIAGYSVGRVLGQPSSEGSLNIPVPTATATTTPTATVVPTETATPQATATAAATPTAANTATATPTVTASATPTAAASATATAISTATSTGTPVEALVTCAAITPTASATAGASPTATTTSTVSTPAATATASPTPSPTPRCATPTAAPTIASTAEPTTGATATPTGTAAATPAITQTPVSGATATPTSTPVLSATATGTAMPTATTATPTGTIATPTATPTSGTAVSGTPAATATADATPTATATTAAATPSATAASTVAPAVTSSPTATVASSPTATATGVPTSPPTATRTPTAPPTQTRTPTVPPTATLPSTPTP